MVRRKRIASVRNANRTSPDQSPRKHSDTAPAKALHANFQQNRNNLSPGAATARRSHYVSSPKNGPGSISA
jgi:hypothetical protein